MIAKHAYNAIAGVDRGQNFLHMRINIVAWPAGLIAIVPGQHAGVYLEVLQPPAQAFAQASQAIGVNIREMEERKTTKCRREGVKCEAQRSHHGITSITLTECAQPPGPKYCLQKRTMEGHMLHGKCPASAPLPGGELALFNQASFLLEVFHKPACVWWSKVSSVLIVAYRLRRNATETQPAPCLPSPAVPLRHRVPRRSVHALHYRRLLQPQHSMLFIHIGRTDFERMLLIPIHLETQNAVELARGCLRDRYAQRDLLQARVAAHPVQEQGQHGLRQPLAPCCRSHVYTPDSPLVTLFAPFVPNEPSLADHVPTLEGSHYEVAFRYRAQPGGYALRGARALILQGASKGIGLAC